METNSFADLWPDFIARLQTGVYCNMATIDRQNRPRSRMIHPEWELVEDKPVGWLISWPKSHKAKHLAHNPHVSLAYIHDLQKPVYLDCKAEWIEDKTEQWRVWELHKQIPPPMGFDPEPHYGSIEHEYFGLLKFTPWRVELGILRGEALIWRGEAGGGKC